MASSKSNSSGDRGSSASAASSARPVVGASPQRASTVCTDSSLPCCDEGSLGSDITTLRQATAGDPRKRAGDASSEADVRRSTRPPGSAATGRFSSATPRGADYYRAHMLRLMSGYFVTQAIRCAAELRLADELEGGPKSAEELAEAAGCSVPHLRRLLEALAGVGVFTRSNGRFALTALGDFIRYGRPDGLWPVASLFGDEMYEALMALTSSVRSGRLATSSRVGASLWDYFAAHPERGRVFDEALGALGRDEVAAIVEAYDFSAAHTVVDVGGGNGALLRAILERHAHARGVLFETPGVVDRSERSSDDSGRLARCDRARGDFFAEIVPGGDIYVLKHVLHDWSDEDALRILRSCRAALSARARLLIIEIFLDRPSAYRPADWMSLGIMTAFGGKERTSAELHELCVAAGLAPGRVISTDSPASIMEAQRA